MLRQKKAWTHCIMHLSGICQLATAEEELDPRYHSHFVIASTGVSGAEHLNTTPTTGGRGWVHLGGWGCLYLCTAVFRRDTGLSRQANPSKTRKAPQLGQVEHFPWPEARSGTNLAPLHSSRVSHNFPRHKVPLAQKEELGWKALNTTRRNTVYNIQKQKAGLYSHYDHDRVKEPSQPSRKHLLTPLIFVRKNPKSPSAAAFPSTGAEIGQHSEVLRSVLPRATLPRRFL